MSHEIFQTIHVWITTYVYVQSFWPLRFEMDPACTIKLNRLNLPCEMQLRFIIPGFKLPSILRGTEHFISVSYRQPACCVHVGLLKQPEFRIAAPRVTLSSLWWRQEHPTEHPTYTCIFMTKKYKHRKLMRYGSDLKFNIPQQDSPYALILYNWYFIPFIEIGETQVGL